MSRVPTLLQTPRNWWHTPAETTIVRSSITQSSQTSTCLAQRWGTKLVAIFSCRVSTSLWVARFNIDFYAKWNSIICSSDPACNRCVYWCWVSKRWGTELVAIFNYRVRASLCVARFNIDFYDKWNSIICSSDPACNRYLYWCYVFPIVLLSIAAIRLGRN